MRKKAIKVKKNKNKKGQGRPNKEERMDVKQKKQTYTWTLKINQIYKNSQYNNNIIQFYINQYQKV